MRKNQNEYKIYSMNTDFNINNVNENDNVTVTLENPRAELIYTKYYTNT